MVTLCWCCGWSLQPYPHPYHETSDSLAVRAQLSASALISLNAQVALLLPPFSLAGSLALISSSPLSHKFTRSLSCLLAVALLSLVSSLSLSRACARPLPLSPLCALFPFSFSPSISHLFVAHSWITEDRHNEELNRRPEKGACINLYK